MDGVLNGIVHGSLAGVAVAAALRLLDGRPARVRYTVCWIGLAIVVLLAALPLASKAAAGTAPPPAASAARVVLPAAWWTSDAVLLIAWMLWCATRSIRAAAGLLTLRRAKRRCRALPAHLEARLAHWTGVRGHGRRAGLVVCRGVAAAAVLGGRHPRIAVAPWLVRRCPPEDIDRIVIHEWAHVQRRDDLADAVRTAILATAGWHPAVWWLDRRLRLEREIACDETAVAVTGSAKRYASCLADLAAQGAARQALLMPGALSSAPVAVRIRRLVSPRRPAHVPTRLALLAAGTFAAGLAAADLRPVEVAAWHPEPPRLDVPLHRLLEPLPTSRGASAPVPTRPANASEDIEGRSARSPRSPSDGQASLPASTPAPAVGDRSAYDYARPAGRSSLAGRPHPAVDSLASPAFVGEPTGMADAQPPSPWGQAAAAGRAIGRASREASLATAGFFSRAGRQLAGAF